ncbi:hypothetical protein GC101_27600 [Paenibacillus sp. LMG 31459]|uniref:Uncharacterized protein n=1 Tax=Paenibacillus phytohabitans TaxID=2654978 RepID=A0ABX1YNL3_9BACL|nr:hypothetical protein [Paenibacillus phytohabitans]NOU82633.1 hypothetical protein [Paenibacillus phytohabitans]
MKCGNCIHWNWCSKTDREIAESELHCRFSPARFSGKRIEDQSEAEIDKNLISLEGLLGVIRRIETQS